MSLTERQYSVVSNIITGDPLDSHLDGESLIVRGALGRTIQSLLRKGIVEGTPPNLLVTKKGLRSFKRAHKQAVENWKSMMEYFAEFPLPRPKEGVPVVEPKEGVPVVEPKDR